MPILLYANYNECKTDKEGNKVAVVEKRLVGEIDQEEANNKLLEQLGKKGSSLWSFTNFDHFELKVVSEEEKWTINANRLLSQKEPLKTVSLYNINGEIDRKLEKEKRKLFEDYEGEAD